MNAEPNTESPSGEGAAASVGLGDRVERVLTAVGIHQVVEKVAAVLGVECGCGNRKEILNRMLRKQRERKEKS